MTQSPFKFLDSYTREDRAIFFGREQEIEGMYRKVFEGKILLVYGISGTGKTSLINCGLANKFDDSDWLPVQVRRGKDLLESLANELRKVALTPLSVSPVKGGEIVRGIRSVYLDHFKPIYLIFDQFEELFIFGDREERKQFMQIVKEIVISDVPCKLIFSIREEYLAGVTEFEELIPDFMSNRMRVEKMTRQHAVQVIKGPCKVQGIEVEKGFAETMLERLTPGMNEVELTYLQVFLDKIFRLATQNLPSFMLAPSEASMQRKGSSPAFTLSLIGKTGNVSDLLGSFLDEQINLLENPDEGMAVLKSFVSIKGSRRQLPLEEVSEYARALGHHIDGAELITLLQTFINLRILRDKDETGKYELRHDALATKIYEKITLIEREILEIRQFIDNAYTNHKKRGVYLTSDDLDYIAPYESRLFLSKELSAFIKDSKDRLTRVKRRRRNMVFISAIALLVILSGFSVWALIEKKKADEAGISQLESILKLNENFEKVIKSQEERKDEIYQVIEMSYQTHPDKLKSLRDKANTVKKASEELKDFVYLLEYRILSESENISVDSATTISLIQVTNKTNKDIPRQILFNPDESTGISNIMVLKQRIQNYRKIVFDQVEKKDWNKINFGIEPEKLYINNNGDSVSWEIANFRENTIAGAITNLNNLITEINNIESDAATFFSSFIGTSSFSFNIIKPVLIPQSQFVTLGSKYEARLILSAFDTRANLEAYVFPGLRDPSKPEMEIPSGVSPLVSDQGEIKLSIKSHNTGIKHFHGFVSVRTPDGSSNKFAFQSEYIVGKPTIVIYPVRGNILYRGIDNIIEVSIPGVNKDQIWFRVSNGDINPNNDGSFTFHTEQGGMTTISVDAVIGEERISYPPLEFRILDVPDPVASIEGKKGGNITIKEILSSRGIEAKLDNFFYDIEFEITGFSVLVIDDSGTREEKTNGPQFSEKQKSLIAKLKPGNYLIVKDIQVLWPEKKVRDINDLIFLISE
jgi:gliding motility-associated protein GldM